MVVVKFEKNGQGFYDFDALLNVTSTEFVDTVNFHIEVIEGYAGGLKDIKIRDSKILTDVFLFDSHSVNILRYFKESEKIHFTHLSLQDLKMMVGVFNE